MSGTIGEVSSTWTGEELEVTFHGQAVRTDYGVPDSTHIIIEDISIAEVRLFGHPIEFAKLPDKLLDRIHDLADDLDW